MKSSINILCVPFCGPGSAESNLAFAGERIRAASTDPVDVILLPEAVNAHGEPQEHWSQCALASAHDIFSSMDWAPQGNVILALPLLTRKDGHLWNEVLLFIGQKVVFRYQKRVPTLSERENGVRCGNGPGVFDSPLGRLGILTCFDINYISIWTELEESKPDFILFPSMFDGGHLLNSMALHCGAWVISCSSTPSAHIVSPLGKTLASTQDKPLRGDLPTRSAVLHLDFQAEAIDALAREMEGKVIVETNHDLARALLTVIDTRTDLQELLEMYNLELCRDYLKRSSPG